MRRLAFIPASLVLFVACGHSSRSSDPSVLISGDYRGTERTSATSTSLRVSLLQSANAVTGAYANGVGDAGTITGTLAGTRFDATLHSTRLPSFRCDLSGLVSNGGATLNGTFACSDGTAGAFTLTRV